MHAGTDGPRISFLLAKEPGGLVRGDEVLSELDAVGAIGAERMGSWPGRTSSV